MTDDNSIPGPAAVKAAVSERAESLREQLAEWLVGKGPDDAKAALLKDAHALAGAAAALDLHPLASIAWSIACALRSLPAGDSRPPGKTAENLLALEASLAGAARAARSASLALHTPSLWLALTDSGHAATASAAAALFSRPLQQKAAPPALLELLGTAEVGLLLCSDIPDCTTQLKTAGWRIMVLGSSNNHETRLAAIRAGVDRFIPEPFTPAQLANAIERQEEASRYSVLIVDGDPLSRQARVLAMLHAGFEVHTLADAQRIPQVPMAEILLVDNVTTGMTPEKLHSMLCRTQRHWPGSLIMIGHGEDDPGIALAGDTPVKLLMREMVRKGGWSRQYKELTKTWQVENQQGLRGREGLTAVTFADARAADFPLSYVSLGFEELTGYTAQEVLGRNCRFLQGNDNDQPALVELRKAMREQRQVSVVLSNYRKDGSLFWNDLTLTPIFADDGELTHYVGVQRDVTQQIKDKTALHATVENLRTIQERLQLGQTHAHVGTMDWEVRSGRVFWSKSVGPLFGHRAGEIETDLEHFFAAVHPDDCESVMRALDACVRNDMHYDMEYRVVWPDGSIHWQSGSGAAIHDARGEAVRLVAILQDINTRKQTEIALIKAREEADRTNRTKSEFLSHMSHELRTPMNAILGFAQLMQYDDTLPESHVENVHEILQAGNHLIELINEVLDLAKIESGGFDLSLGPVAVSSVIEECLSLIQPASARRGIEINYMPSPTCGVRADRTRLKQALLNIISNGVKYNCDHGTLSVSLAEVYNGDWVRIGVHDTGEGMKAEELRQIFEPFERLGQKGSNIEGTGIGLTITKRMVELMGGSVNVESTPGSGSTFSIELPREDAPPDWPAEEHGEAAPTPSLENAAAVRESSVLYVEDNPSNIRLMAQIIALRKRLRLQTAHSADLGRKLAVTTRPDLIILDINLPGIDGYDMLRTLRSSEGLASVPIVALSANALPGAVYSGRKAGFDDYLTKPVHVSSFLKLLDRYLGTQVKETVTTDE